jgi:hypothetical protein
VPRLQKYFTNVAIDVRHPFLNNIDNVLAETLVSIRISDIKKPFNEQPRIKVQGKSDQNAPKYLILKGISNGSSTETESQYKCSNGSSTESQYKELIAYGSKGESILFSILYLIVNLFHTIDIEAAIDKGRNTTKRTTLAPIVVLIFTAATLVVRKNMDEYS